jgi:hypothetical protein
MAQQTALEQFIEWIDSDCTPMDCLMKAKELLKVEKEQIMTAWLNGDNDSMYEPKQLEKQAEQYYNETYGTEG